MKLILLALIQSLLLCAGQMFMKLALKAMGVVSWSWSFIWSQITNWWWLACGISFTAAGLLWMSLLKELLLRFYEIVQNLFTLARKGAIIAS